MKKNICILGLAALGFCCTASITVFNRYNENGNICYTDLEFDEDDSRLSVTVFCGDCTEMPYTIRDNQLTCHLIEQ